MNETEALADAVFQAVKGYCESQIVLRVEAEVEKRIAALPKPKDGESGKNGVDGVNGKDVDADLVIASLAEKLPELVAKSEEILRQQLETAINEIPLPEKGKDGRDGKDGVDGIGLKGDPGDEGRDGRDGKQGPNGRDALDIEILPSIDAEKSYPRSTYAKHSGGLFRSFETTEGMKGWECIVNGIDTVEMRETPEGRPVAAIKTSDGQVLEKVLPAIVYRGVFSEGKNYGVGDFATFGGSLWHCNTETTEKPGTGTAWQLAAKKGRDAT